MNTESTTKNPGKNRRGPGRSTDEDQDAEEEDEEDLSSTFQTMNKLRLRHEFSA